MSYIEQSTYMQDETINCQSKQIKLRLSSTCKSIHFMRSNSKSSSSANVCFTMSPWRSASFNETPYFKVLRGIVCLTTWIKNTSGVICFMKFNEQKRTSIKSALFGLRMGNKVNMTRMCLNMYYSSNKVWMYFRSFVRTWFLTVTISTPRKGW